MKDYHAVLEALRTFPDGATAAQVAAVLPGVYAGTVAAALSALKSERLVTHVRGAAGRPGIWRVAPPTDEATRLRARVAELEDEVARLRERLRAIGALAGGET